MEEDVELVEEVVVVVVQGLEVVVEVGVVVVELVEEEDLVYDIELSL